MSDSKEPPSLLLSDLPDEERIALEAAIAKTPILTLYREFETFDPFDGKILAFELQNVGRRARELLVSRSVDEIQYAVMAAEHVTTISLIDPQDIAIDTPPEQLEAVFGVDDETRSRLLYRRRKLIDIRGLEDLPKAKWFEIFAALALAYVAQATNRGIDHSMNAMDAIGYAEGLLPNSKANAASKIVDKNFKDLLEEYVEKHPGYNRANYATKFCKKYKKEMIARRSEQREYSLRTLSKWAKVILANKRGASE